MPGEQEEILCDHTVKELKEWLEQFSGNCKVYYKMDCFHGLVTLIISNGVQKANLRL